MEEGKQEIKNYLRSALVKAIEEKYEFGFLEKLCEDCAIEFGEPIYDPCLERYINFRKEGEPQFRAKYASLFITSWNILFEEKH